MKEIKLSEFKRHGLNVFKNHDTNKLRVLSTKGRYINMFLHNKRDEEWEKEGDVLINKAGKKFRECKLCGSIHRVRYIVPYDGSAAAGAYCYYCRRKHSLMDVKDAKRYSKIL
jgi:hypothetical protein